MAQVPENGWKSFPQKLALGLALGSTSMLVGYFIWLGTNMVEIKQKVTSIEASISSLNTSRRRSEDDVRQDNTRRLDELEKEGSNQHDNRDTRR